MNKHRILLELEDIHYKYKCLTSLIGIMRMFVEEIVDIAGAPEDSISNALFEIEIEMEETNKRLNGLIQQEGE